MRLKFVVAVVQYLACAACGGQMHRLETPSLYVPVRQETSLLNSYFMERGRGIRIQATMSKSDPGVTDGIRVRVGNAFYQIVWQGAGNFVVYAGSNQTAKLEVVAASDFMKSDVLFHDFLISIMEDNKGNHIVASVDHRRLIDVIDKTVIMGDKRISVAAIDNGYLAEGLIERE
jgi:hypothetical protein